MGRALSDEEIGKIYKLNDGGFTQKEIADKICVEFNRQGLDRTTIYRRLKKRRDEEKQQQPTRLLDNNRTILPQTTFHIRLGGTTVGIVTAERGTTGIWEDTVNAATRSGKRPRVLVGRSLTEEIVLDSTTGQVIPESTELMEALLEKARGKDGGLTVKITRERGGSNSGRHY